MGKNDGEFSIMTMPRPTLHRMSRRIWPSWDPAVGASTLLTRRYQRDFFFVPKVEKLCWKEPGLIRLMQWKETDGNNAYRKSLSTLRRSVEIRMERYRNSGEEYSYIEEDR